MALFILPQWSRLFVGFDGLLTLVGWFTACIGVMLSIKNLGFLELVCFFAFW
jgi:hypothetical protein